MHAYSRLDRPYRLKGLTSHERVDIPGHRAPADACATDRADGPPGKRRTPGGHEPGGPRVPAAVGVPGPGASEPATTEPGTTEPGTTEPGTTEQHPGAA